MIRVELSQITPHPAAFFVSDRDGLWMFRVCVVLSLYPILLLCSLCSILGWNFSFVVKFVSKICLQLVANNMNMYW